MSAERAREIAREESGDGPWKYTANGEHAIAFATRVALKYAAEQVAERDALLEEIEAGLCSLRSLIESREIDSLGVGRDGELEWPIRDEVVDSLSKRIAKIRALKGDALGIEIEREA